MLMKKILIVIPLIMIAAMVFVQIPTEVLATDADTIPLKDHRMIKEITVNYKKTDEPNARYGYYKEVFRKYNYHYKDSSRRWVRRIDRMHTIYCYINEYGDTVMFRYIDYTDYPRRD